MKTKLLISATFILLVLSIAWMFFSLWQVKVCIKEPVWFARSGAIVVLFSVWSTYITKPILDKIRPNIFIESYQNARDNVKPEATHWLEKYEVLNLLYVYELLTIAIGTCVWAYGDTWIANCVISHG